MEVRSYADNVILRNRIIFFSTENYTDKLISIGSDSRQWEKLGEELYPPLKIKLEEYEKWTLLKGNLLFSNPDMTKSRPLRMEGSGG